MQEQPHLTQHVTMMILPSEPRWNYNISVDPWSPNICVARKSEWINHSYSYTIETYWKLRDDFKPMFSRRRSCDSWRWRFRMISPPGFFFSFTLTKPTELSHFSQTERAIFGGGTPLVDTGDGTLIWWSTPEWFFRVRGMQKVGVYGRWFHRWFHISKICSRFLMTTKTGDPWMSMSSP